MKTDLNDDFNDPDYPIFDLWKDVNTGGDVPDDLLARVLGGEEDYEDEYFDPDEFE